jgi:DNA (cytosine-5)-methyltransferase 1
MGNAGKAADTSYELLTVSHMSYMHASMTLTVGTVCSGIAAPECAWAPLGWDFLWSADIEPFPNAVRAARFQGVPNLGDMTAIAARILAGEVAAPDVLVGGTPCQSFSVAGLRGGLSDERGNLALEFIRLADAIDAVRRAAGKPPAWILWENVPGVLSDAGNAFGAFLGGMVGGDAPSFRADGGQTRVWCMAPAAAPHGASWTPSSTAWPSDGSGFLCSLAEVLEPGPLPTRYFLSSRACAGILRRAEKRGKTLPGPLLRALQAVAGIGTTPIPPTTSSPPGGGITPPAQ